MLYTRSGRERILLNVRSQAVEHHKGEVAFPGGRWSAGDRTLLDTALRETHEEMGVPPGDVEVLGQLDDVVTISNFLIRPFVGTVPSTCTFSPNEREVAEVLEAPVDELTDTDSLRDTVRLVGGALVNSPSYAYRGHLIFGATAEVLTGFIPLLEEARRQDRAPAGRGT